MEGRLVRLGQHRVPFKPASLPLLFGCGGGREQFALLGEDNVSHGSLQDGVLDRILGGAIASLNGPAAALNTAPFLHGSLTQVRQHERIPLCRKSEAELALTV